jgi:hypothetical protein
MSKRKVTNLFESRNLFLKLLLINGEMVIPSLFSLTLTLTLTKRNFSCHYSKSRGSFSQDRNSDQFYIKLRGITPILIMNEARAYLDQEFSGWRQVAPIPMENLQRKRGALRKYVSVRFINIYFSIFTCPTDEEMDKKWNLLASIQKLDEVGLYRELFCKGSDLTEYFLKLMSWEEVYSFFCQEKVGFESPRFPCLKGEFDQQASRYQRMFIIYVATMLGVECGVTDNFSELFIELSKDETLAEGLSICGNSEEYLNLYSGKKIDTSSSLSDYRGKYVSVLPETVWSALQAFIEFIVACNKAWCATRKDYHSPFTVICQGSCSGKTFLALNSSKFFAVNYLNLREKQSQSLPQRTTAISDYFESITTQEHFLVFYRSYFEVLSQKRIKFEEYYDQVKKDKFWEAVMTKTEKGLSGSLAENKNYISLGDGVSSAARSAASAVSLPAKSLFLFVIDEAKAMLNPTKSNGLAESKFLVWRRSIAHIQNAPVFFVLLDTTSKLSNFQPSAYFDPSLRCSTGLQLFFPFYFFPFTGEWKLPKDASPEFIIPSEHGNAVSYELFSPVRFSRPYFFSRVEECGVGDVAFWKTLVAFAVSKLGTQGFIDLADSSKAAVVACKFALVPMDSFISEDFVSSFCATLTYVNASRTGMKVQYIPEPMLAEGASFILASEEAFLDHLALLENMLLNQKLAPCAKKGDLGEFVASIFVMRIKDMASANCKEYYVNAGKMEERTEEDDGKLSGSSSSSPPPEQFFNFSLPIPISAFLKGFEITESLGAFGESLVNFTSYQKVDTDITNSILKDAFLKNYAIIPQVDQDSFDLLIPLLVRSKADSFRSLIEDASNYTAVTVHVKNYSSTISQAKAMEWSEAQCNFIRKNITKNNHPIVSLVMAVGTGVTNVEKMSFSRTGDLHIVISKFPSFPGSITENVSAALTNLLNVKGLPTSLVSQAAQLFRDGYSTTAKPDGEKEKLDQYIVFMQSTAASFQPDSFGCNMTVLKEVAKRRNRTNR